MLLRTISRLFLVILPGLFIGFSSLANGEASQSEYLVQPGDILAVSVWKEPDLQKDILVRPDGNFTFPLVGEIQAQGKTIKQLSSSLTQKLSKFLPSPSVTVSLTQMNGNRIYVLGKVKSPGVFTIVRPVNILQVLAMAGGLTVYANEDKIRLLRTVGEEQQSLRFDYSDVKKGKRLQQNVLLQPGDVIIVP